MTEGFLDALADAVRVAEDRVRRAQEIEDRLSEKRVHYSSPDDTVKVTIDGNGKLLELTIAPGYLRRAHVDKLGTFIRKTINSARAEMARKQGEIVSREFGVDLGRDQ